MTPDPQVAPIIDPARLTLAREAAGLRKGDLASKLGISSAAVGQFEAGFAKPSAQTLDRISAELGFSPQFFAFNGESTHVPDLGETFFRSLRSTRVTDRSKAVAHAWLVWEVVRELSGLVEFPELRLPSLTLAPDGSREEAEAAATQARRFFGLDDQPVENVVRLLERTGVVVTRLLAGAHQIDAFSCRFAERPIVVLTDDKGFRDRSRFDAAHELGHLVMHPNPAPADRVLERQAQSFAAAFLMPASAIRPELPTGSVDWKQMISLKRKWGVSVAALLYRSRTLGTMSERSYESAMKTISRRGWRTNEPGSLGRPEQPVLLARALEALAGRDYTIDDLANSTRLPIDRLQGIVQSVGGDRVALAL